MKKFKNLRRLWKEVRSLWKRLRNNWKIKYRLIIKSDSSHQEKFSFKLSPKNVFVVITSSVVILIILTAMLIAFTPLRVYVPGYTNPDEYRLYKKIAVRVDSMNITAKQNQQYINNFYRILNDEIFPDETQEDLQKAEKTKITTKNTEKERPKEDALIRKEAYDLTHNNRNNRSILPAANILKNKGKINTLLLQMPVMGRIVSGFDILQGHYGIDIVNEKNTLISSIAEGVVIFTGFDPQYGNTIIIQHPGNVISQYKCNNMLLLSAGQKVILGEPIARMGNSGLLEKGVHLHFELWFNGVPINPLDYLPIE